MGYYKIYKDNWQVISRFNNMQEAQAKADSLGTGYSVEYLYPYVAPTPEERLGSDIDFCNELINVFLQDNRIDGVTTEQGEALMIKFSTTLSFAQVGAITSVDYHIKNMSTDSVFTQERKTKYLDMIQNYLNQY